MELLPGSYTFKMYYHNGIQQITGETIDGISDEVAFITVTATMTLKDSDGTLLTDGGNVKYYTTSVSMRFKVY